MIARTSEIDCVTPELSSQKTVLPKQLAKESIACAAEITLVRSGYLSDWYVRVISHEDKSSYTCQ